MQNNKYSFLLIEDDPRFRRFLHDKVCDYGEVRQTSQLETAKQYLQKYHFDFVFIDMKLGDSICGIELASIASRKGIKKIIVLTGYDDDELGMRAYKAGATDFYLKKNFKRDANNYFSRFTIKQFGEEKLKEILNKKYLTKSPKIIKSLNEVLQGSMNARPIFIDGESGVGKTQFARIVYELMGLTGEFVELNCAGLSENLLESELFGHIKGSFSGATSDKDGKLKQADGGILFLDEVGDMPKSMQATLLKAIEEKTFYPVGGNKLVKSDFLVVSATKQNLAELLEKEIFRDDFYNRITSRRITIPSLRERKDDIPLLINYFLKKCLRKVIFTQATKDMLEKYNWYGNIRELGDFIENISTTECGIIEPKHLPEYILDNADPKRVNLISDKSLIDSKHISYIEKNGYNKFLSNIKNQVLDVFEHKARGKQIKVAEKLQISRGALWTMIKNRDKGEFLQ